MRRRSPLLPCDAQNGSGRPFDRLCPLWHGTAPLLRVSECVLYFPYSPPYSSRAPRGLKSGLQNGRASFQHNPLYLPDKMCFYRNTVCIGLRSTDQEKPRPALFFLCRSANVVFLFAHARAYTCACMRACEELFPVFWNFLQTTIKNMKKLFSFSMLNTERKADHEQTDADHKARPCHEK